MAWKSQSNPCAPVAQPERPQRLDQPGQQFLVGLAAHPPGVGAQVGGLGQGGQAEGERQAFVIGQRPGVGSCGLRAHWPAAAFRSTATMTGPGRGVSAEGAGSAGRPGHGGQQEQQPGVIARQVCCTSGQRAAAALTGSSRAGAVAAAVVAAGSRRQALDVEDLPSRSAPRPASPPGARGGDLGDGMPGGAQLQHPLAELAGGLARAFGPGLVWVNRFSRPGAASWPSGGCWRWSSRTGRRPRRRASSRK